MSLLNNLSLIFFLLISTPCFAEERDFNTMDSNKHLQEARRYLLTNDIDNAYKHLESIPLDSPEEIYKQRQELIIKVIRLEKDIRGNRYNNFNSYSHNDNKNEIIKNTPSSDISSSIATLVGFLFIPFFWLLPCFGVAAWAKSWSHSFVLFIIISIFFSPVLGGFIVLILGKRKICPNCAEKIKTAAIVCPYCKNNVSNL